MESAHRYLTGNKCFLQKQTRYKKKDEKKNQNKKDRRRIPEVLSRESFDAKSKKLLDKQLYLQMKTINGPFHCISHNLPVTLISI